MDIGFVTAFVGGTLALLSPCAALLMPAFFASTVGAGPASSYTEARSILGSSWCWCPSV